MIRVVTDTVASIPVDVARDLGIEVVSLSLLFDGVDHVESELDLDTFYESIAERIDNPPVSSQPSAKTFEDIFESAAAAGDEVCAVFLSSQLSGTFDGAIRSANLAKSHNLGFRCVIVDGASAGGDLAFAAMAAAEQRNAGGALEDCVAAAENAIMSSRILFAPESLAFLKAGGRIGAASALLGSLIKITPVLTVRDGRADTFTKVRTYKKALNEMVQIFKDDIEAHGFKRAVVHYIGARNEALYAFRDKVSEAAGCEVSIVPISPVLGSHVGPAMGLAYECLGYLSGKITTDVSERVYAV
jgi:DegV family protein with EDD domain